MITDLQARIELAITNAVRPFVKEWHGDAVDPFGDAAEAVLEVLKEHGSQNSLPLTDREADLLKSALYERQKSIMRKRSWRPSEKAMALAENNLLYKKVNEAFPVL